MNTASPREVQSTPSSSWFFSCAPGFTVSLIAYRSGDEHPRHSHSVSQLSLQLLGQTHEILGGNDYQHWGPAMAYKPAGEQHSDRWQGQGALIFSLNFDVEIAERAVGPLEPGWYGLPHKTSICSHVQDIVASPAYQKIEIAEDLVALATSRISDTPSGPPPLWLVRVREQIGDDPAGNSIGQLAEVAGLHRVYISREFVRFFGVTPSRFRRRQMAMRLVSQLAATDETIAQCAIDAGFYDQSHAARALRAEVGIGPSKLRALFAA